MNRYISSNGYTHYVPHLDINHLLSRDQIEIVKDCTRKGDVISFQKGEEIIEGTVKKTFDHIFLLEDGRSFTFVDYILGSPSIINYLRRYHPIEAVYEDPSRNYYEMKMMRVN